MVAVMLPVASKLSFLELGYLCASAELAWPMDKTRKQERRKAEGMEEHKNEQANEWMDACMHVHVYRYE